MHPASYLLFFGDVSIVLCCLFLITYNLKLFKMLLLQICQGLTFWTNEHRVTNLKLFYKTLKRKKKSQLETLKCNSNHNTTLKICYREIINCD